MLDNMTKIFCKAKRSRMSIRRVIRWYDIVPGIHNEILAAKSKVHVTGAVPEGG
jgi:hypothetical protein